MHAVYGNKCVDVSSVRCWVQQFKQKVGEAVVSGQINILFKGWNSKLITCWQKLEIMWKNDYAVVNTG